MLEQRLGDRSAGARARKQRASNSCAADGSPQQNQCNRPAAALKLEQRLDGRATLAREPWQGLACQAASEAAWTRYAQQIELQARYDLEKMRLQQERDLEDLRAQLAPRLPPPEVEYEIDIKELGKEQGNTIPLLARARDRFNYQEAKRQANIERIASHAMNELPLEVSDEPVDEDWIARFFNAAKDVSGDRMQHIWGKLLAGAMACR